MKLNEYLEVEIVEKETISVAIVEKDLITVDINVVDYIPHTPDVGDLGNVELTSVSDDDILYKDGSSWKNIQIATLISEYLIYSETPTKITSKQYRVSNHYIAGTLVAYLNGIKEKNITEDSSRRFSFPIDTIIGDEIEVCYIKKPI